MPDLATGSIRTVTTLVIGAFLTAGADWVRRKTGVQLPADPITVNAISGAVYAFITAVWYLTFASLERRWPLFGVFLGWPKAPHYDETEEPPQELPGPRKASTPDWRSHGADPLP